MTTKEKIKLTLAIISVLITSVYLFFVNICAFWLFYGLWLGTMLETDEKKKKICLFGLIYGLSFLPIIIIELIKKYL